MKKGEEVKAGTVVASVGAKAYREFDLASLLGLKPFQIIKKMKGKLGKRVEKDEVVVRGTKEAFVSPVSGVLESLSEKGILRIKLTTEPIEVQAPFSGEVSEVSASKVVLSFPALEIRGEWGGGKQGIGELALCVGPNLDLFNLSPSCQGQVVALLGTPTEAAWHKAVCLGLAGMICGASPRIEAKDQAPLVVLGGNQGVIPETIWSILEKNQGKKILVEGEKKRVLIPSKDET